MNVLRTERLLNVARVRRSEVEAELAELDAEIAEAETRIVSEPFVPDFSGIVSPCAFDHGGLP